MFPSAEFIAAQHGQPRPNDDVIRGCRVIIIDFSYSREDLEAMNAICSSLMVLDHHSSAEKILKDLPYCHFDMNESGASMALSWFKVAPFTLDLPPNAEALVSYVRDHDLWLFELNESRAVRLYFRTKSFDFGVWSDLCEEGPAAWIEKGKPILAYQQQLVESHVSHARTLSLAGRSVLAVPCTSSSLISDVAGELAKQSESGVGATWFETPEGIRVYSLRSAQNGEARSIAERFGGGGHPDAAGFSVPVIC